MNCYALVTAVILHHNINTMKIDSIHPQLNLQSFYDFAKMSKEDQCSLILKNGMFLDADIEKDSLVKLYFLNGFFVEEVVSLHEDKVIDIIPYKQGYRLESYLEVKSILVPRRTLLAA